MRCSSLFAALALAVAAPLAQAADAEQAIRKTLNTLQPDLKVESVSASPLKGLHQVQLEGGRVLYSGPLDGLRNVETSETRKHLFAAPAARPRQRRAPQRWLKLRKVSRNNLRALDVDVPLGVLCAVTGISGSGKSSLAAQALVTLVRRALGRHGADDPADEEEEEEGEEGEEGDVAAEAAFFVDVDSGVEGGVIGDVGVSPKRDTIAPSAMRRNGACIAAGRIRYSQLRRLAARGAENAVPDSCSA